MTSIDIPRHITTPYRIASAIIFATCVALTTSTARAADSPDVKGFRLGMTKQDVDAHSFKVFGSRLRDCYVEVNSAKTVSVERCGLTTIYGSSEDLGKVYRPKPGVFTILHKDLSDFSVSFLQNRLYKVDVTWREFSAAGLKEFLQGLRLKYGDPLGRTNLQTEKENEVRRPLHKEELWWASDSARIAATYEVVEFPLAEDKSGKRSIDVGFSLLLEDVPTRNYINSQRAEDEKRTLEWIKKGWDI